MRRRSFTPALALAFAVGPLASGCDGSALEREGAPPSLDAGSDPDADVSDPDVEDGVGGTDIAAQDAELEPDASAGPDATSEEPAWEGVVLGDLGQIDGVAAASADAIWAVSGPRVLRWNGVAWLAFGTPDDPADPADRGDPPRTLRGVWSDGVTVVVVGDGGFIARRLASGAGPWTDETSGVEADLWAIAGRGADDLVAVGDDGLVLRWRGAGWETRHSRPGLRLRGVFAGAGEGDGGLHAVGSGGQLVEPVGGTWRSTQIARSASTLSGFAVLDDGTLAAVGTAHTLTARRPTAPAWQGETSNDTRERDLHALVALRDGTVRAFGASGLVLARDASGLWQLDAGPGGAAGVLDFAAASGFGTGTSAGLMAVGRGGGGVLLRGGLWSTLPTRPDVAIRGLAVDSAGNLWAAGTRGTLLSRAPGGDFSALPLPTDADLNAVVADPLGGVWVAGTAGRLFRVSPSGEVTHVSDTVPVDLHDVAATAEHVVAVGRGGTVLVWARSSGTLTYRAAETVADLRGVTLSHEGGSSTVWIAGSFGTLMRGPLVAGPFESVETGTGASLHDLAFAGGEGWAVGDGGVILRLDADAATATLAHEASGVFLKAVSASDAGVLAVGAGGAILARPAGAADFSLERPFVPQGSFGAVVVTPDGVAWLGSNRREASLERRLAPWGGSPGVTP
jgi:hypothetical protein